MPEGSATADVLHRPAPDCGGPRIEPGIAIDGLGREIVVPERREILDPRPPSMTAETHAVVRPSNRAAGKDNDREGTMPLYLSRFSYTPETWARLIGSPEDRRQAAQSYIESVGGELHGFWYAFGTHDGYNLWEAPDNVSMAAVALAISGGGALSSFETTVLLTVDDTMDALRKAEQVRYQQPGT